MPFELRGLSQVIENLYALDAQQQSASRTYVQDAMRRLYQASREAAPYGALHGTTSSRGASGTVQHRKGEHLRDTAYMDGPKRTSSGWQATVGYTSEHALSTHENQRTGRTGGVSPTGIPYRYYSDVGGWKYLEQPLLKIGAGIPNGLATALKATLR